jgi:hypothetical protein
MLSTIAIVLGFWSGQLVDGHVHRAPHGGVLAHCGPYLVEVVVRRTGDVTEKLPVSAVLGQTPAVVPDTEVDVWLLTERETAVNPGARRLKVRSGGREATLAVLGGGFSGRMALRDPSIPLDVEVSESGHTEHVHLTWTNLDDRARLDDGLTTVQRQGGAKKR